MSTQAPQDPVAEIWQLFKETDARLDQRIRETDARLDQRFHETDEKLRRLEGLFGNQWGKLMEALVQPGVLQLFQRRGIEVHRLHQRSKAQLDGKNLEVDLILENGSEVVVVEVKRTLGVEDVNDFLDDLEEFLTFFPIFQGYRVYGAVAGLTFTEEADRYAYRKGLFVVQVIGETTARILNNEPFHPTDFDVPRASTNVSR
jgi:predicted AAA+ superfamily ATPase